MHIEVLPVGEQRMDISIWLHTRSNRIWLTTLKRMNGVAWQDVREAWSSTKPREQAIYDSVSYHLGHEIGRIIPIQVGAELRAGVRND